METLLQELSQYHFPGINPSLLLEEPYLHFTNKYCSVSSELLFFRGYLHLTSLQRAQIYRALSLACDELTSIRNFVIFTSSEGMTIRTRKLDCLDQIEARFEFCLENSEGYVFLPEGYDKLSEQEYHYYYRLLQIFKKTSTNLSNSRLITFPEYDSRMLFISLNVPQRLQKKWKAFLSGSPERKLPISSFQIKTALQLYTWNYRSYFKQDASKFRFTVLEMFPDKLEQNQQTLREAPGDLSLLTFDLGQILQDEHELIGLLLILQKHWPNLVKEMYPLMGTSKLLMPYSSDISEVKIQKAIQEFIPQDLPMDEVEIHSQIEFGSMNLLQKANLVRAPSGHWYSFMDLVQTKLERDPLTRDEFPQEFKDRLRQTLESIRSPVLEGFPVIRSDPELFTMTSDHNISFYIRLSQDQTFLFWKLPQMDPSFVDTATKVLALKWTDNSLFGPFKEACLKYKLDPGLIFSPRVYSIFREFLENPSINLTQEQVCEQLKLLVS